jgi:hypothetical protein
MSNYIESSNEQEVYCSKCGNPYPYEDEELDGLPHGVVIDDRWICSTCMVDENGETLPEYT